MKSKMKVLLFFILAAGWFWGSLWALFFLFSGLFFLPD
jgi:hypothetical protein